MTQVDSSPPILVTGAAGRHGGTGRRIVELLRQKGRPVRAMVRKMDDRCADLVQLGAEVVVADYMDYEALYLALSGVKRAYFCFPVNVGITEATVNFVAVAKASGLEYVVNNSMPIAHPASPSPLARAQWMSEQILNWSGLRCLHVKGAFFFENILLFSEDTIVDRGVIENGFGDAPLLWVAADDVASVAAFELEQADPAQNSAILVTGGELLTFPQIAERISIRLGRKVGYRNTGDDEKAWKKLMSLNPRIPPAMRDHLVGMSRMLKSARAPRETGNTFTPLIGKPAASFDDFLDIHSARLLRAMEVSSQGHNREAPPNHERKTQNEIEQC
jgi:NAD(P)H dehydrogenase (quinone)